MRRLEKDIIRIATGSELACLNALPVAVSNSSDPYPDALGADERTLGLTRHALELLADAGFQILLTTKSDLVFRDLDVLARTRSVIAVTVTTLDEAVAARLEPFAPSPRRRLRALAEAAAAGLAVACRVDPLIPGINSAPDALARLCDELAQAGVRRIISSTYKHKADNFRRLAAAFSREASLLSSMFVSDARVSGYRYLRREVREEHLGRLRELAHERGLSVSVCREGLPGLNDGVCDARDLRWQ